MDKTLKRQIGYRPSKTAPQVKAQAPAKAKEKASKIPAKKKVAVKSPEIAQEVTPKQVVAWINSHPLFKWGGMCFIIGINRGNFVRTLQDPEPKIKPEIVLKIVALISKYGFTA